MRTRRIFTMLVSILAAGAILAPAGRALADDESDEVNIEIKAPLDAVSCNTTPQTITVLGLTIDVTAAHFESGDENDSDDDSESASSASGSDVQGGDDGEDEGDDDGDDDGDDEGENDDIPATCADLVVGRTVEVKLASDVAPLLATEVGQEDEDEDDAEIKAPLQAVDPALGTITVLGLVIDISGTQVEGCDDEDDDDGNQGIDPATLMVGQFVEVELDRNALPGLVARELEVKNFTNTVEIDVEDNLGNDVDDLDDHGQPIPTVTVDVTQSVRAAASSGKGAKGSNRTLHFRAQSNGRVRLHGLATGRARVTVMREAAGATSSGRGAITIAPNATTSTTIRLKGSKRAKTK